MVRLLRSVSVSFVLAIAVVIAGVTPAQAAVITIPLNPAATFPEDVAIHEASQKAYVTSSASSRISVINAVTHTVITTILVPGVIPFAAAVNQVTGEVYVTNTAGGQLLVINTATDTVTHTIAVGGSPQDVAVNQATQKVYVANGGSNSVSVIDASTHSVTATIPGIVGQPSSIAVNEVVPEVYVGMGLVSTVVVIDTTTNTVAASVPVAQNFNFALAVDQASQEIYVGSTVAPTVKVVSVALRTVIATIPVGLASYRADIYPSRHTVYVSNNAADTVTAIDTVTKTVTNTIPVGDGPRGIAVDQTRAEVYVANSLSSPPTVSVIILPTVTGVSPSCVNVAGGTPVTLTGRGFGGATSVTFGGVAGTNLNVLDDGTLTVVTPAHSAGTVDVVVTTPEGWGAGSFTFTQLGLVLGKPVVVQGDTQSAVGSGFRPGEVVTGTMLPSLPLGQQTADSSGVVRFVWTIPHDASVGEHGVVLSSGCGDVSAVFRVTARTLPETGVDGAQFLACGVLPAVVGVSFIVARRLRRQRVV